MKKRNFDNLVLSIKEMKKIEAYKMRPARVTKIRPVPKATLQTNQ